MDKAQVFAKKRAVQPETLVNRKETTKAPSTQT